MEEKRVKKTRAKRPNQTVQGGADVSEMLRNAMIIADLPEIDTRNNEAVKARVQTYFQICVDREIKPTMEGLSLALGVNRRTLLRWVNGETKDLSMDVCLTLRNAVSLLEEMMSQYMVNGKINPVAGIFLMANNHGYQQRVENVNINVQAEHDALPSADSIRDRYLTDGSES